MRGICRVAGLLLMTVVGPALATASDVEADAGLDAELKAFVQRAAHAAPRTPRSFSAQLANIHSSDGRRVASPRIELVAGRIDTHHCLYQLRLKVHWSGRTATGAPAIDEGRALLRRADCGELVREVSATALREVSALRRQLRGEVLRVTAPRATPDARRASAESSVAAPTRPAAVEMPVRDVSMPEVPISGTPMRARVGKSRLALRVRPDAQSPLMQRIAPGTELQLLASGEPGWYALADRAGFVAAIGLVSGASGNAATQ